MITWLGTTALSLFILVTFGCTSTGVGNPGTASQALVITEDSELEPGADEAEPQLAEGQLTHAVLIFEQFRFVPCDAEEEPSVLQGPFVVDLVTHSVTPELGTFTVPESGLCGIDAVLGAAERPPRLVGRSILFQGVRSDGITFLFYTALSGTLKLRPLAGTSFAEADSHGLLWAFRPRRWLLPSELDAEQPEPLDDTPSVLVIDVDRHPALFQLVRSRLAARSTLHLDLNDNRELDEDERAGEALIGQGLGELD